ncbi:YkgJ family cysteine cluster protein [Nitrogeniibacter mangrovi]|uniref:YkgJ family cysteine cluster protein n=1 Tax=Nitrogeniibacter mangrovi TaxID=2016596 RepID=A0A6C1B3J4_9RHOO|nr:YkgJ family cysteine cluster protein [Nitrogeniibacter mangrovi]QID18216.1 YkgJ family cysteine cluster protein [Nitrogeniibacter mangrovi]
MIRAPAAAAASTRPAVAQTPEAGDDPCTRCGACCAAFRVDFHVSELGAEGRPGVPPALTVPVTPRLVRMRGTDAAEPRCVALVGQIGWGAKCGIYTDRPSPCRDFAPYAPLGIGDAGCARARRRHGLPPLTPGGNPESGKSRPDGPGRGR